jgi:light-regulated signal transduction histidine kinase (bacteriophytochrome)
VEADPTMSAPFMSELDETVERFERAVTVSEICRQAARTFRDMTGYGRVMIY